MRLIATLLLVLTLAAGPAASAEEDVVTGPLPRVFDVAAAPLLAPYRAAFEAAWAGDCSELLAIAPYLPEDGEEIPPKMRPPEAILVTIQMLDRGLCLDFDPVLAASYLERLYAAPPANLRYAADLAWRYWHGFGVEKDRVTARRLFDRGLLGTLHLRFGTPSLRGTMPAYTKETLLGFPLPPYAVDAAEHIQARITDPATRLDYARALALGGPGLLPAGHSGGLALPGPAYDLFFSIRTVDSRLEMVRLGKQGVPRFEEPFRWLLNNWSAAVCGSADAISRLRSYFEEGGAGEREAVVISGWLLAKLGWPADLEAIVEPKIDDPDFVAQLLMTLDQAVSGERPPPSGIAAQALPGQEEAWAIDVMVLSIVDGIPCTLESAGSR